MHRSSGAAALLFLLAALLFLSGCYSSNIDQYFSPPQPSREFQQLQSLIDQEISAGCGYSAPTRGSYRQSVQLIDLNDDGYNEALAFLRDEDSHLKIVIYEAGRGEYHQVLSLSEKGRSIGRVAFLDMDNDGRRDLVVTWQISSGLSILSVYSLLNWSGDLLMSTDCTEFASGDLDQNGQQELLVIRAANSETYLADMYSLSESREPQASTSALSSGIAELLRTAVVTIAGGQPALLVESSTTGGDVVTDLLVYREGALVNLTLNRSTAVSEVRRSFNQIFSQDIDGDGNTEVPYPQQLYNQGGGTQWSVAWYRYDVSGRASLVTTTYHCVADGWYFVLPGGWDVGLTVRRDDSIPGEHAVILSRLEEDGTITDRLTVYAITGENRTERTKLPGRFLLEESSSTVFAAEILSDSIDRSEVENRFHIIYTEWSNGSV